MTESRPLPKNLKSGRKQAHPIDILRTRLWYRVVELRSGLGSAHALELELEPNLGANQYDGLRRPTKYRNYRDGDRTPQRTAGKAYAVDVAEGRYPGTRWYFETPMWDVLKHQKLSINVIDEALRNCGSAVAVTLLDAKVSPEGTRRFRDFDKHHSDVLIAIGTFEAFAASVLLIAKSEAIANPSLRDLAFETYYKLQPRLEEQDLFAPLTAEIFRAVDLSCKLWIFPTSQSRVEIVVFSDEMRRHLDEFNANATPVEEPANIAMETSEVTERLQVTDTKPDTP